MSYRLIMVDSTQDIDGAAIATANEALKRQHLESRVSAMRNHVDRRLLAESGRREGAPTAAIKEQAAAASMTGAERSGGRPFPATSSPAPSPLERPQQLRVVGYLPAMRY
jgi:hypothetical protein